MAVWQLPRSCKAATGSRPHVALAGRPETEHIVTRYFSAWRLLIVVRGNCALSDVSGNPAVAGQQTGLTGPGDDTGHGPGRGGHHGSRSALRAGTRPDARDGGGPGRRAWEELAIAEDHAGWLFRSRVFLTPIAAPSIMGLFGFMIATLMLGAWQAGQ
jgi:hypothetical protein